jgi:hypothetical protein
MTTLPLETPWSTLQLAYYVGAAMWTYLTQPFTFTLPGCQTHELVPWKEAGQQWRRLRVVWPSKHRIFPRDRDGESLTEPLIVSIDLSEISFT